MTALPAPPHDGDPAAHAHAYADCGIRALPIKPGAKYPPMDAWQHAATIDHDMIDRWYSGLYAGHGCGLAMGPQPDGRYLFALDVDEHDPSQSGSETLHELEEAHGKLPETVRSLTGGNGAHLIFVAPEGVTVRNGKPGAGLDIRGDGGQIVVAPTYHPDTGARYEWEDGHAPWEHAIAEAPAWLLELVADRDVEPERPPIRLVDSVNPDTNSPADHLRTTWNWHAELAQQGWQWHHNDHRGDSHWTRPGKDRRQGSSGVLHEPDGPFVVFSTDDAVADLRRLGKPARGDGVSISPLVWYATYNHHGNIPEATRHIRQQMKAAAATTPPAATKTPIQLEDGEPDDTGDGDWARIDLVEIARLIRSGDYKPVTPTVLHVEGATPLFYPARTNSLFGESGGGKTWVAIAAVREVVRAGGHALVLDWEDNPHGIAERVVNIGLTDNEIGNIDYRNPSTGMRLGIAHIEAALNPDTHYELVVVDSTGEAMAAGGVNPNADEEVALWFQSIKALTRLPGSPAVVVLDHIPKDKDAPSAFAIGSQRKRAAITGAAYRVDTLKEPAKGRDGKLKLTVTKDRPGNRAKNTTAAIVDVIDIDNGQGVDFALHLSDAQQAEAAGERFRPTVYMERVSRFLELNPGASVRAIQDGVSGKKTVIKSALEVLVEEGYVAVDNGPRGALLHTAAKPFRDDEEISLAPRNDPKPSTVPPWYHRGTDRGTEPAQTDRATVPPSFINGGTGGTVSDPLKQSETADRGTPPLRLENDDEEIGI